MEIFAVNFIGAIAMVIDTVLSIYFWVVFGAVVLSWVNADPYNPIVSFLRRITDPVFYKIRKWMPFTMIGGLDLSPMVLLLGIQFAKMFIVNSLYQLSVRM